MERAATAPEPQAPLVIAPHLGRPTPPEAARQRALSKPIQPILTAPARARRVASTSTEQVATMALRNMPVIRRDKVRRQPGRHRRRGRTDHRGGGGGRRTISKAPPPQPP